MPSNTEDTQKKKLRIRRALIVLKFALAYLAITLLIYVVTVNDIITVSTAKVLLASSAALVLVTMFAVILRTGGKGVLSLILMACIAAIPYVTQAGDSAAGYRIEKRVYKIKQPKAGQPVVLPHNIPARDREEVLKAISQTRPGGPPIMIVPSGGEQYAEAASKLAESAVGITPILFNPFDPIVPNIFGLDDCFFWIVVIIVLIVVAVIYYVVCKICEHLPPAQSTSPPTYNDPSVVVHNGRFSLKDQTTGGTPTWLGPLTCIPTDHYYGSRTATNFCLLACTDLAKSNWFACCTISFSQLIEVTNSVSSNEWSTVTITSASGQTLKVGATGNAMNRMFDPVMETMNQTVEVPDAIVVPLTITPIPDKMFFRLDPVH